MMLSHLSISLNPCSNGRYFRRLKHCPKVFDKEVLILVLMEDTLGVYSSLYKRI